MLGGASLSHTEPWLQGLALPPRLSSAVTIPHVFFLLSPAGT